MNVDVTHYDWAACGLSKPFHCIRNKVWLRRKLKENPFFSVLFRSFVPKRLWFPIQMKEMLCFANHKMSFWKSEGTALQDVDWTVQHLWEIKKRSGTKATKYIPAKELEAKIVKNEARVCKICDTMARYWLQFVIHIHGNFSTCFKLTTFFWHAMAKWGSKCFTAAFDCLSITKVQKETDEPYSSTSVISNRR